MSPVKALVAIFAVNIGVGDCNRFRNRIPLKRRDQDYSEDDIPIGFVDSVLIYGDYNPIAPHPCDRQCSVGNQFVCYYQLYLEHYESYNDRVCREECIAYPHLYRCPECIQTDGVKAPLLSINRQLPGPPINMCVGDLLIVDVINNMTEPTSLHWHGIDQSLTPYMDGMPFITQAEIPPNRIYRYKFVASNHGTNFYHSHSLWQRGQGIYGTLVVRLPLRVNPHWYQYDEDLTEHSIVVSDWNHNLQRVAQNFLINGKGWFSYSQGSYIGQPNVFHVRPRFRYRFRIIFNAVINVQMELSLDNHFLTVIAADGTEVRPVPASSIVFNSGERFDFVLAANQPIGNYWLKVCNPLNRTFFQVAIIRYEGAPFQNPPVLPDVSQRPPGLQINTLNVGPGTPATTTVTELQGLNTIPWLARAPWRTTYLEVGINFTTLTFEIDKIAMVMPNKPLLLEKDRVDSRSFCNRETLARQQIDCSIVPCRCTHVITYDLNSYVELIFFGDTLHPIHLHGYLFYVVGMGVTNQPVTRQLIYDMDRRGLLPRNNDSPVLKDTVQLPRQGYVIIRFYAFNPGYWFLHCHVEFHATLGMTGVLQIGQPNQMLPQPRSYRPYPT